MTPVRQEPSFAEAHFNHRSVAICLRAFDSYLSGTLELTSICLSFIGPLVSWFSRADLASGRAASRSDSPPAVPIVAEGRLPRRGPDVPVGPHNEDVELIGVSRNGAHCVPRGYIAVHNNILSAACNERPVPRDEERW
jgi:hypothetical protein